MTTALREIAVRQQDFDLAAFLRDVEISVTNQIKREHKEKRSSAITADELVNETLGYRTLRNLYDALNAAKVLEAVEFAGGVGPLLELPKTVDVKQLEADAEFVLNCDIDDLDVSHIDDDLDVSHIDDDLDAIDAVDATSSEYMKTELNFEQACKHVARNTFTLLEFIRKLQQSTALAMSMHSEVNLRATLLYARGDEAQRAAVNKYEDEIAMWKKRALTCCFCKAEFGDVKQLMDHSAECQAHPLFAVPPQ